MKNGVTTLIDLAIERILSEVVNLERNEVEDLEKLKMCSEFWKEID